MSDFTNRLQAIKDEISNNDRRRSYIEKLFLDSDSSPDEFESLIHYIIKASFEAGIREAHRETSHVGQAGRIQGILNSNQQAEQLAPLIQSLRRQGIDTLQAIADELNDQGIKTRGNNQWYASSVRLLLERIKLNSNTEKIK